MIVPHIKLHSNDGTRIRVTIEDYSHETHEKTRKLNLV